MKQGVALLMALALVSAVSAIPAGTQLMTSDIGLRPEPFVEIIDRGSGDVAAIFVTMQTAFEPVSATILRPEPPKPRIIAFLVDRRSLEAAGGMDALIASISNIIKQKGIRQAAVVTCKDCMPAAAALTESMDIVSGLVVMNSSTALQVPVSKAVFFAPDAGDTLFSSIGSALSVVELKPPVPRRERRGLGYTLE